MNVLRDETLLKISLIVAVLGISGLFLYSQGTGPTGYSIYELEDMMGSRVQISGTVISLYTSKEGHTFLQVSDGTGQIKVVAFEGGNIDTDMIEKGHTVTIEGRVSEYQGKLEIIADSILVS